MGGQGQRLLHHLHPAVRLLVVWIVPLLALVRLGYINARLAAGADEWRVQYLPDDAFYYLNLARQYVTSGLWSVDGGQSVTSGYHPLFAYGLAALWGAAEPGPSGFVTWGIAVTGVFSLLAAGLLLLLARRLGGVLASVVVLLILASDNYTLNALSMMEWPFVVVCAAAYMLTWTSARQLEHQRLWALRLAGIGFVGSLARADFGLLPACLWLSSSFIGASPLEPSPGRAATRRFRLPTGCSSAGLAGALAGVLALSVHARCTSGQWLQSSALMKAHWAGLGGVRPLPPLRLLLDLLGYSGLLVLCFLAFTLLRSQRSGGLSPLTRAAQTRLGAWAALVGYVVIYARSGYVQPWYSSTLIVPAVCCVSGWELRTSALEREVRPVTLGLLAAAMAVVIGWLKEPFLEEGRAPWPHHASLLQAGHFLGQSRLSGRVGSWNSGIVGYYEGGRVINLDGLVNNSIYAYAVAGRLPEYIVKKDIRHLVDFSRTFEESGRRRKGGYDDAHFLTSLEAQRVFGQPHPYWGRLTLYDVRAHFVTLTARADVHAASAQRSRGATLSKGLASPKSVQ